ncbi:MULTISPECIES: SgcJ/EcaC family oxidoreductase [unclassified Streptomyces]|uniref:SgcJ/EcaC family oxidoreductase n=1 Tax=unclassified Streptomyces TaxID=2593676 RepID=UPI003410056D
MRTEPATTEPSTVKPSTAKSPSTKSPSAESADLVAIRQLVDAAVASQSDPDRFLPLHTADTSVVNFRGRRVAGREALDAAMRQALASPLADVVTTVEVEDIRLIRDDVALVASVKHVSDRRRPGADGDPVTPLHATSGRLTYVLVKEAGTWRIASAQTTPILD